MDSDTEVEVTKNDSSFHSSEEEIEDVQNETHNVTNEEPTTEQLLQAQIQSLEATNRKLRRENYFLTKYLCLMVELDLKEQQASCGSSNGRSLAVVPLLYQYQGAQVHSTLVVLRKIFKEFNQETLLGCRLVSRQWNHTITNNIGLMERITFPIWHPKLFLDLQIANQVKSIVFKESFAANSAHLTKLLEFISKTVRKITFDYELDENSILNQQKNFLEVLDKCTELQELKIIGNNKELMKACRENTIIAAASSIKKLSIKPKDLNTLVDHIGISRILNKLPKLTELEIFLLNDNTVDLAILRAVYDYMVMYPTVLKRIRLRMVDNLHFLMQQNQAYKDLLITTLLMAGKNGATFDDTRLDLNSLLNFRETNQLLVNACSAKSIKNGFLIFDGDELKNLNIIEVCTELKSLCIRFQRNLFQGEIKFLRNLLALKDLGLVCPEGFRFNWESITQLDQQVFSSGGLPTVRAVGIAGDVFGLPRLWSCYFPNLKSLGLYYLKITPKDLFIVLSTLEKLVELFLDGLTELEDEAFTTLCTSKKENGTTETDLPAIATFKMLTTLTMNKCPKLTNKCVVDGISKITMLKELCIEDMPNLIQDVCNGYHFKVTYKT